MNYFDHRKRITVRTVWTRGYREKRNLRSMNKEWLKIQNRNSYDWIDRCVRVKFTLSFQIISRSIYDAPSVHKLQISTLTSPSGILPMKMKRFNRNTIVLQIKILWKEEFGYEVSNDQQDSRTSNILRIFIKCRVFFSRCLKQWTLDGGTPDHLLNPERY